MPFSEGHNLSKGRPKGASNKTTAAVRQMLKGKFEAYIENGLFDADLSELEAKDRIDAYLKIAPFILPKLQSTTIETGEGTDAVKLSIDFKNASVDELTKFINSTPAGDTTSSDNTEG